MNTLLKLGHRALGIVVVAGAVEGCTGRATQSAFVPVPAQVEPASREATRSRPSSRYVYVADRTARGASELLVFPAGVADPSPVRSVTHGIVDAAGVAVDESGNVYVANGSAGNVLEFAPGGTSLVQTYSKYLVHPIGVTVAKNTLYVSDRGSPQNGYMQGILEYPVGDTTPSMGIGGIGNASQLNEGIAVNATSTQGAFYVTASTLTAVPPVGPCPNDAAYSLGENMQPTLWMMIPLSHNVQASGIAFDAEGNMYVADPCANDVAIYSRVQYVWTYSATVPGTYSSPMLLSISQQYLAVPSSGGNGAGYVTVIDLAGRSPAVTISKQLRHPVGAAVGTGP